MERISRADIADAEEILALQRLAFRSQAALYNDFTIPPMTQTLDEVRAEFSELTFLKATESGRIAGSVRASLDGGTCHIGRLSVHPDYQHRGIGTRLMQAIETEFPGAERYELFAGSRSFNNIRLYERLGYNIYRKVRMTDEIDLVYMEKLKT